MNKFLRAAHYGILIVLLSGCSGLSSLLATPQPATSSSAAPTPTLTPVNTATPTAAPGGPHTLHIWVSPQFDPAAKTPAAHLLQARLDEFVARRPDLQIEVRLKDTSNMITALSATNAAAPANMPDLVALSRTNLESATSAGLLHPLDGLTTLLDDPDWYPYAMQMARIQNTTFGLPFAGDALVLAGFSNPLPNDWNALEKNTFIFPASDPQALFSLSLYLTIGGKLTDDQGHPTLDEAKMAQVLSFYAQALANKNLSPSVISNEGDSAIWQGLKEGRANLGVTWASNYLKERPSARSLALLPSMGSDSISLASGYAWALAGTNSENQALAVELAEFLTASDFLAGWTEAAGVLPTRPTALSSWKDAGLFPVLSHVSQSAQLIPSSDLLLVVGPLFQQTIASVLNGEKTPEAAAQDATAQLK